MNTEEHTTLKIRFRLPNGEEFEAEGPQAFIESQRNYFLGLIGHIAPALQPRFPQTPLPPLHSETYVWEQLLKEDGNILTLRQKTKLSAQDTALILLAGARVLLRKSAYPALDLARSLKSCGIDEGRQDRLLAGEIQAGRMIAHGVKRSRTYQLTEEGFARAFMLAENLQT